MSRLRILNAAVESVRHPPTARSAIKTLAHAGFGLGLLLVFVSGSLLSVVMYANLPAGRRLASSGLQRLLASTFEGRFAIDSVEHVSLTELRARGITVQDPDGHVVLSVSALSVQADLLGVVQKLLYGTGEVTLRFEHARLERAEVYLLPSRKNNVPTIVEAFTPTPSMPGTSSAPSSRTIKVWFPAVEVGYIYGRMALDGVPTLETELSSVHGSIVGSSKLTSVDVERFSAQVRGLGGADAKGVGSVHVRAPGAVWTSFDGYFGDVQLGTVVRVVSPKLDVSVDVPRAQPAAVRALWAGYPLHEDVTAHVEGVGTLEKMQSQAKLSIGAVSSITANGEVRLTGHVGADLDVSGRRLDLRAVWPTAPVTDIDADTDLAVFQAGNTWVADLTGKTRATQILGTDVPPVDVTATYRDGAFTGHALANEPGAPLNATFAVHPDGSIDGTLDAKHVDLARAPRLQPYFEGRGLLDLNLKARVDKNKLVAQVSGKLQSLQYGSLTVESSQFSGRATGPLNAPERLSLDLSVASRRLRAGALGFDHLDTKVSGPVTRPTVSTTITNRHGPQITAQAKVTPRSKPRIDDLEVQIQRDEALLTAKAAHVDVNGQDVRVDGMTLEGAGGSLQGSGEISQQRVALTAHGSGLDLQVVAHALGLPRGLLAGKLGVDADLESAGKNRHGTFQLKLDQGQSDGVGIESLAVSGKLDGTRIDLQSSANLPTFGEFSGEAHANVAGSWAKLESFEDATGVVTLKGERIPFGLLSYVLSKNTGVDEVRGYGSASLVLDRSEPEAIPNASLVANTNGLYIGFAKTATSARPPLEGVEAHAGLNVNGRTGETDLTFKLDDQHGALLSTTTRAIFDLEAARKHPQLAALLQQARSTPLVSKLVVDDRSLADLPAVIAPEGVQGRLRSELSVRGTVDHPVFSDKTELSKLRFGEGDQDRPIDVCAQLDYDKTSGQYGLRGELFLPRADTERACQGGRVAQLSAGGRAEWAKLTQPNTSADPAWTGTAGLSLEGMPIDIVPTFADAGFGGRVFGVVMFDRRGALPQVRSQLEVREAVISRARLGTAALTAQTDGRSLNATLAIEQPPVGPIGSTEPGGTLKGALQTSVDWQGVVPGIDDTRPISATIDAKNLDAVILSPFVHDVLSEVGGKLDAQLHLNLTPALDAKADQHWTGAVKGTLSMRDGALQLAQLGLRMRNVKFDATAEDHQNATLITINSLTAAAESDKTNIAARGNIWLSGFKLDKGNANATVRGVPFLVEGVTLATLNGAAAIDLERRPTEMFVGLTIPELEAKLPQQGSRDLISLGNNEDIVIAQPLGEPRQGGDAQSLPWRMKFDLGRKVKVTRADLFLPLTGSPEIRLGEDLQIVGNIDLTAGGRLSVPGLPRPFTIETGTVFFDEGSDAKNPRLKVRAVCQLSQLTVWANVSGTFRDAKISFDSDDPSLSEAQIEAALLSTPSPTDSTSNSAAAGLGAGAGYIGKQLFQNTALSNLELKAGSETTADQRSYQTYSAAYPITDELWFEGSYKQLQTADQSANSNAFSGTLDYRFRRNWSLRTEVGNIGAGVDLLWLYRY